MWDQFFQNCYFSSKTEKINELNQILESLGFSGDKKVNMSIQLFIWVSLSTKFQLKQTI